MIKKIHLFLLSKPFKTKMLHLIHEKCKQCSFSSLIKHKKQICLFIFETLKQCVHESKDKDMSILISKASKQYIESIVFMYFYHYLYLNKNAIGKTRLFQNNENVLYEYDVLHDHKMVNKCVRDAVSLPNDNFTLFHISTKILKNHASCYPLLNVINTEFETNLKNICLFSVSDNAKLNLNEINCSGYFLCPEMSTLTIQTKDKTPIYNDKTSIQFRINKGHVVQYNQLCLKKYKITIQSKSKPFVCFVFY